MSYEVRLTNATQVLNSWVVANEVNLSNYNIQRSSDGKSFEIAGTFTAKGLQEYSFTDEIKDQSVKTFYYRIEAVDKNGSKTYSTIKQITIKPKRQTISIYPNPAKGFINISSKENIVAVKVFNQPGLCLINKTINQLSTRIDIQTLQKEFIM